MSENVKLQEGFSQVCVWPACVVGQNQTKIDEFVSIMKEKLGVRVQYLEDIKTNPDRNKDGSVIKETGGRNDLFFSIHNEDVGKFAIPRLQFGIRWIEDVLSPANYDQKLYPDRVFEYKIW